MDILCFTVSKLSYLTLLDFIYDNLVSYHVLKIFI